MDFIANLKVEIWGKLSCPSVIFDVKWMLNECWMNIEWCIKQNLNISVIRGLQRPDVDCKFSSKIWISESTSGLFCFDRRKIEKWLNVTQHQQQ